MAVTPFQSRILKLLADNRRDDEASYVAGGVALNLLLRSPRLSHDIGLFCGDLPKLENSLSRKTILFHHGSLRGVWPQARP